MEIAKSYITNEEGSVKSVIIDFDVFKKIEEALLDQGLAKAMEEVEGESEISAEEIIKSSATNGNLIQKGLC